MGWNLVVWQWKQEFKEPSARKKQKLKMSDVAHSLIASGDHAAAASFTQEPFVESLLDQYPGSDTDRPFLIERYPKCVLINYDSTARINIVPVIGRLAMKHGLNGTEA